MGIEMGTDTRRASSTAPGRVQERVQNAMRNRGARTTAGMAQEWGRRREVGDHDVRRERGVVCGSTRDGRWGRSGTHARARSTTTAGSVLTGSALTGGGNPQTTGREGGRPRIGRR